MKELHDILSALSRLSQGGPPAVLATLMKVEGSAYRGAGARMLVLPDGAAVGALSGGCLEKDVVAHAEPVRAERRPKIVTYDLTRDDDAPWGLGMGCAARLEVLLEPAEAGSVPAHLAFLRDAAEQRQDAVVATVFRVGERAHGRTDRAAHRRAAAPAIGDRLMLRADGRIAGTLAEGLIGAAVREKAQRVLREGWSDVVTYAEEGSAEVLFDYVPRAVRLVLAGGENDVAPLARLAGELGWQARVLAKDEVPGELDERTAAVVATHNYWRDAELLEALLPSAARYVGLLGPRARRERLLADLGKRGVVLSAAQLARFYAPIGLDIGAETPREIALAVVAEIQAVLSGRGGASLRERTGVIHDRR